MIYSSAFSDSCYGFVFFFFFQAEDGIRDLIVTGVQTCALPIFPMAVRGSAELLPRGSWQPAPGEIEVVVGTPIPVAGMDRDELIERVRAFMEAQLAGRAGTAGRSATAAR